MSVCGLGILLVSLLTLIYYKQILHGCPKIPGNLTNVMIYILLNSSCMSLSVTAYCSYSTIQLGKLLKEMWPEIRFARPQKNSAVRGEDEEAVSIISENAEGSRSSRASSVGSRHRGKSSKCLSALIPLAFAPASENPIICTPERSFSE
jgi:hypothetical protein